MKSDRQQLIEEILHTMAKIRGSFHHGHGPLFAEFGFGMPHLKMLFCISGSKNGLSIKELAECFHITPGAVTQFVDRLLEKGLIERFEDQNDRRIVHVRLTDKAKEQLKDMKQFHREKMAALFTNLSGEELQQLSNILQKITLNCDEQCYHWRGHK